MPNDPQAVFARWRLTPEHHRARLDRAPTPRERERRPHQHAFARPKPTT